MKRAVTLSGVMLVILLAGSACHRAGRTRDEIFGHERMMGMRMKMRHNMGMPGMRGNFRHGMGDGMMRGMGPGMGMGMMHGMHPGMGMMNRMPMDSLGWMPAGPGRRMLESIPNVTENQKKQIEDLMKKNQDEMKKLREEMSSKMMTLMETHRKDILNILTDDQKKYIESDHNKPLQKPDKTK
jgi:hypothetical protein